MYEHLNNNTECCICLEELDCEALDGKIINISDINRTSTKCSCSALVHHECIAKWYRNKKKVSCIICNSTITLPRRREQQSTRDDGTECRSGCRCFTAVFLAIFVIYLVYISLPSMPPPATNDDSSDYPSTMMLDARAYGYI